MWNWFCGSSRSSITFKVVLILVLWTIANSLEANV